MLSIELELAGQAAETAKAKARCTPAVADRHTHFVANAVTDALTAGRRKRSPGHCPMSFGPFAEPGPVIARLWSPSSDRMRTVPGANL
jgi:hypothetical protein